MPIQTTPPRQDNQHNQHHPLGQAQRPPRLIAQATVAHLPSKTIDHGAGPVDQSLTAPFIHSAHHLSGTSRRDNSSATTGDHD
ncbi:MAG: hypothetical protein LC644_03840, partial [Pseudonocardia sp.]|nr:hypothetical protein [Pseudonocardia sp.]